jgi:hypothetical protein
MDDGLLWLKCCSRAVEAILLNLLTCDANMGLTDHDQMGCHWASGTNCGGLTYDRDMFIGLQYISVRSSFRVPQFVVG